ncbi:hypothetical protein JKP88DRAFT_215714 [Tribonema minus]|uniref:Uncharacterized protein n=1 Tax=Tribonema minus TaxID=303371 RepID=A0A835YQ32_9STRA|nr:hypothetical protein JKP88DRAFT_215714 [Tribonema minus]
MRMEESCLVYDVDARGEEQKQIIFRNDSLVYQSLHLADGQAENSAPCQAARAFSVRGAAACGLSSWSSGALTLPPRGLKAAERVDDHTQLYWVTSCRPYSLELAIAKIPEGSDRPADAFDDATAQRYLLSPGDHFYVPPRNVYRLENHAPDADAQICWAILNPPRP